MSYHQLPNWKHYWNGSPDLGLPMITSAMSRNRFEQILNSLHGNDNSQLRTDNRDKIFKLRPVVTALNKRFEALYKPTRKVSVYESMILFRGRSSIKQYSPMKPIKRGYKIWCMADQNGYVS
ncbi:Transposase IS4 [Popillia japonica]|uniref:Transposase IS4 n=1 Tax=Popillia japonica TaxID=7064 RepID=A0AAW1MFS6_POPJA